MDQKHWYQSKMVWFNVVMTILGITAFFQARGFFDPVTTTTIQGIGNVILRIWFTNTSLTS